MLTIDPKRIPRPGTPADTRPVPLPPELAQVYDVSWDANGKLVLTPVTTVPTTYSDAGARPVRWREVG